MSRMSDFDICAGELRNAAQSLNQVADSLLSVADTLGGNTPEADTIPDSIPQKHTAPEVTLEQVRAVLAEKSGDGKRQAVKELLFRFDAGKLSGVKPEDYAAVMEEAMKL